MITVSGHSEVIELLVTVYDADKSASNSVGETPFHTAAKSGMQCTRIDGRNKITIESKYSNFL